LKLESRSHKTNDFIAFPTVNRELVTPNMIISHTSPSAD